MELTGFKNLNAICIKNNLCEISDRLNWSYFAKNFQLNSFWFVAHFEVPVAHWFDSWTPLKSPIYSNTEIIKDDLLAGLDTDSIVEGVVGFASVENRLAGVLVMGPGRESGTAGPVGGDEEDDGPGDDELEFSRM